MPSGAQERRPARKDRYGKLLCLRSIQVEHTTWIYKFGTWGDSVSIQAAVEGWFWGMGLPKKWPWGQRSTG